MRAIWKFKLLMIDHQIISGLGLTPMSAGLDPQGDLCLWGSVDDEGSPVKIEIAIRGTGRGMPPARFKFLETVKDGSFMWHIFTAGG